MSYDNIKSFLPGLMAAGVLAVLAVLLGDFFSALGPATVALLLGIILGNAELPVTGLNSGMSFTEKKVLETSIVLLGFGINARIFSQLGWPVWAFVGASVIPVMLVAFFVGKAFRLSTKFSVLLGAGSAICGSTAIGAVAPLIRSKEEETGLSMGIINLLGTIGLLLMPVFVVFMDYSKEDSAMLVGGVLQSMGHVVGAGFALGEETGTLATIIKMGRIVLISPLLIFLYFMTRRSAPKGESKLKGFPVFVLLFIISIGIAQLKAFPNSWAKILSDIGNYLLIAAMVAIGFKIRIRPLFKLAGPALLTGILLFAFQIAMFMVYLHLR